MTQHLSDLLYRLRKTTVIRYGIASVGALAVDMGLFLALLSIGMMAAIASAIGYSAGIVACLAACTSPTPPRRNSTGWN